MRPNLFFYLLKQSVLKSLESAFLGTILFSIIALGAFVVMREFPPLTGIELTGETIYLGVCSLALFIGCIVAGGMGLGLWLFWYFGKDKFSFKEIALASIMTGYITWIVFFIAVVVPIAASYWGNYFAHQDMLAVFFDSSSFAISLGSGFWTGKRLFAVLQNQKTLIPEMFKLTWKIENQESYLKTALIGSAIGALGAMVGISMLSVMITIWPYIQGFFAGDIRDFSDFFSTFGRSFTFINFNFTPFTLLSAILSGYGISHLFYLNKLNDILTRKNAFWQASITAGLTAFCLSILVGCIFFSSPRLLGSTILFAPYIFAITFVAWLFGGLAGILLFKLMKSFKFFIFSTLCLL